MLRRFWQAMVNGVLAGLATYNHLRVQSVSWSEFMMVAACASVSFWVVFFTALTQQRRTRNRSRQ